MLETKDLIIKKASFEDWPDIYRNVWSRPDCAKYMMWQVTTSEEDARARMQRTLKWEAEHDACFVYEKTSGQAIGFAGVEPVQDENSPEAHIYEEGGICVGTEFQKKGYGRQILRALMAYVKEKYAATEFQYSAREANTPSRKLAVSEGFELHHTQKRTDERDGSEYTLMVFRKAL